MIYLVCMIVNLDYQLDWIEKCKAHLCVCLWGHYNPSWVWVAPSNKLEVWMEKRGVKWKPAAQLALCLLPGCHEIRRFPPRHPSTVISVWPQAQKHRALKLWAKINLSVFLSNFSQVFVIVMRKTWHSMFIFYCFLYYKISFIHWRQWIFDFFKDNIPYIINQFFLQNISVLIHQFQIHDKGLCPVNEWALKVEYKYVNFRKLNPCLFFPLPLSY
jgi:hypothetical protein